MERARARRYRSLALAAALATAAGASPASEPTPSAAAVAVGEVGPDRALLWARAREVGELEVELDGGGRLRRFTASLHEQTDFTARIPLRGLQPDISYRLSVRLPSASEALPAVNARFRTAPAPDAEAPLRLVFGGDLGGQNVCRDADAGYSIFRTIQELEPSVFLSLGDMIYADGVCKERGRYGNLQVPGGFGIATDLEGFRAHWRYNRSDPWLTSLLERTPYVAVWDDHEIVNDASPHTDTRDTPVRERASNLLPAARRAFLEWNPVLEDVGSFAPLYRSQRWGRHLELFVLDTRSHRDSNSAPDDAALPKTLLGVKQRRWLVDGLIASDATWKVVVTSVPLSIPTGSNRERIHDGWADGEPLSAAEPGAEWARPGAGPATGFERELLGILARLRDAGVSGLLFLTTDVHFAAAFRYRPFAEDPEFTFHELVTGPLNAGLFPHRTLDTTLLPERLFWFGPTRPVDSIAEALGWFNFGVLDVDGSGRLEARIVDGSGRVVYALPLELPAAVSSGPVRRTP
jgi:alkaline phosphatase D